MISIKDLEIAARCTDLYHARWETDDAWMVDHPHCGERWIMTVTFYGVTVCEVRHAGTPNCHVQFGAFGPVVAYKAAQVAREEIGARGWQYIAIPTPKGSIQDLLTILNRR